MIRRPPISTRTDTLFPYTTLFRSRTFAGRRHRTVDRAPAVPPVRLGGPRGAGRGARRGGDADVPGLRRRVSWPSTFAGAASHAPAKAVRRGVTDPARPACQLWLHRNDVL